MLDIIKTIAEIVGILAAAIGLPGVTLWYLSGRKSREEEEQRSIRLILKGVRKIGQLSFVTAARSVGKELNGEVKDAMDDYNDFMDELNDHIDKKACH